MMQPNKSAELPEESKADYTPGQRALLQFLQWGAWTAVFVAMLYIMHA